MIREELQLKQEKIATTKIQRKNYNTYVNKKGECENFVKWLKRELDNLVCSIELDS